MAGLVAWSCLCALVGMVLGAVTEDGAFSAVIPALLVIAGLIAFGAWVS